ncbi:MAG: hypothetical protein HOA52_01120 [Flavobacteriales bacterium]|jgi:hypothetical protein|nr:hypothetical protein [Flavobacteriales bacterium]MBT6808074.1 hypothetical protein [Flavobacteriales bacterium]
MNTDLIKGVLIGVISPLVLFIFIVVFFRESNLTDFINHQVTERNLPSIISLTLLANLSLFFIKIKMNKDEQSRGILLSTFLYGIIIVYLKLF